MSVPGKKQQPYHPQQYQPPLQQQQQQQQQPGVHSLVFDHSNSLQSQGQQFSYPQQVTSSSSEAPQFYQSSYATTTLPPSHFSNPSLTNFAPPPALNNYGVMAAAQPISWLAALGTGGPLEERPLLEELEINPYHIQSKTIAVLNPIHTIDKHIMDDTDIVGPLFFCLLFGISLLFSGKAHFGYIYGVGLMGWISIYIILNLMSEQGIDTFRTASVLGTTHTPYPSGLTFSGALGLVIGSVIVLWCTISSSNMFVAALSMKEQRLLVAYPVGLFYFCFALMTIF